MKTNWKNLFATMAFREIWCLQRNFDLAKLYKNFPKIYYRFIRRRGFFSSLLLRSNGEVYRIFWQSFLSMSNRKNAQEHLQIRSLLVNSAPQEIRESGSRPLIGYQHYTLAELTAFPRKSPTSSLVLTKSVPPININTKSRRAPVKC
jgi:hypothetical protein